MKALIKKFGKINSSVLLLCIIFLVLELIGHRHGETSIEDFTFLRMQQVKLLYSL
jgi:hypothetical protein